MGERNEGDSREIRRPSADQFDLARERARKLLVLKRLGDALGRPVEDFYGDKAEHDATWRKVDDNG